jgi:Cys-rich repeat protein
VGSLRRLARAWLASLFPVLVLAASCQGELRLDDLATTLVEAGAGTDSAPPGDSAGATETAPRPACSTDTDCKLATLHCDVASGTCVECVGDQDCAAGPNHRCDGALHQCVQCGVDGDCAAGQVCVIAARRCVTSCTKITDCVLTGYICDLTRDLCVRCFANNVTCLDNDTPICAADGTCVQCGADSDCSGTTPRCDQVTGSCVACLSASDCQAAAPLCDPGSHTCSGG